MLYLIRFIVAVFNLIFNTLFKIIYCIWCFKLYKKNKIHEINYFRKIWRWDGENILFEIDWDTIDDKCVYFITFSDYVLGKVATNKQIQKALLLKITKSIQ